MTRLDIPDLYKDGLVRILNLDDEHYEKLLSALKETPLTLNFGKFKDLVASQVPDIEALDDILDTVLSLYNALVRLDFTLEIFVDELCQAAENKEDEQLKITDTNRTIFKDRLFKILDISSSTDLLKAADVRSDHVNVYQEARILTDIRTVFAPNIEDDPRGAVIVHNLKICYYEGKERKDFYVAMDDNDTETLAEILGRATQKSKKLRAILKDAEIKDIEIK